MGAGGRRGREKRKRNGKGFGIWKNASNQKVVVLTAVIFLPYAIKLVLVYYTRFRPPGKLHAVKLFGPNQP